MLTQLTHVNHLLLNDLSYFCWGSGQAPQRPLLLQERRWMLLPCLQKSVDCSEVDCVAVMQKQPCTHHQAMTFLLLSLLHLVRKPALRCILFCLPAADSVQLQQQRVACHDTSTMLQTAAACTGCNNHQVLQHDVMTEAVLLYHLHTRHSENICQAKQMS